MSDNYPIDDAAFAQIRQTEASAALNDVLAEIQPEIDAETPDYGLPDTSEAAETPADPTNVAPAEGTAAQAPAEAAGKANPEPTDRGFMRLLEKEAEIKALNEKVDAKLRQLEAAMDARPGDKPVLDPVQLREQLETDPVGFFEQFMGIDPAQVSRLIIAAKLGDKAPREIREAMQQHYAKQESQKAIREVEQLKLQLEVERVKGGVSNYAGSLTESTHPVLAAVAAVDRNIVEQAILSKIGQDATARGLRGTGHTYLSPAEAASQLEAEWSVFQKALVKPAAAPAPAPTAPPVVTPASTPTATANVTTAVTPPQKRPVPPRKPNYWDNNDRDAEVQDAIQFALAEIKRANTVL